MKMALNAFAKRTDQDQPAQSVVRIGFLPFANHRHIKGPYYLIITWLLKLFQGFDLISNRKTATAIASSLQAKR